MLIAMFGADAEALLRVIRGRHSRDSALVAEDEDAERGERIRELVKIVQESGVGEIEIEDEGMRVSVRRADEPAAAHTVPVDASVEPVEDVEPGRRPGAGRDRPHRVSDGRRVLPGSEPRRALVVDVGDTVVPGQVLCVLEAMKLFNELKAETAGVVKAIHARTRRRSSTASSCSSSTPSPRRPSSRRRRVRPRARRESR